MRCAGGVAGTAQRHQADAAALVDQQAVQLRVEVGHAGFVRERQTVQHVADPADDLDRLRVRVQREPFVQGHALRAIDRNERPLVLHANLDDARQIRMVQACGQAHAALPVVERGSIGGLDAGQAQHQLGAAARVEREPDHRAGALAQQAEQLETAERTGRVGLGRGWVFVQDVGEHRKRMKLTD